MSGKQSKRLRGMQTAIQAGMFKASDIDRNSILSLVQDKKSKVGAYMSKKDLKVGVEEVNDDIKITASTFEGEVMAIQHKTLPLYGVQFHPESILTPEGRTIINNYVSIVQQQKQ